MTTPAPAPSPPGPSPVAQVALVVFSLGREEFGASVSQVREVLPLEGLTPVPRAAHDVEGVMNVRGHILPVLDLRRRLGLQEGGAPSSRKVLVVDSPGQGSVGLVVDEVTEVLRLASTSIESAPTLVVTDVSRKYIAGVAKVGERLILVCDLVAMTRPGEK